MKGHNRAFIRGDLTALGVALIGLACIRVGRILARSNR